MQCVCGSRNFDLYEAKRVGLDYRDFIIDNDTIRNKIPNNFIRLEKLFKCKDCGNIEKRYSNVRI